MSEQHDKEQAELEQRYRDMAVEIGSSQGIEVDAGATVSESDDGAFVQVWVWVPKHLVEPE